MLLDPASQAPDVAIAARNDQCRGFPRVKSHHAAPDDPLIPTTVVCIKL